TSGWTSLIDVSTPPAEGAVAYTTPITERYPYTKSVKFKEQKLQSNRVQTQENMEVQENERKIINQKVDNEFSKTSDKDSNANDMSKSQYPLAVKMMFNYEAESNAPAILRAMYKEMIPSTDIQLDEASQICQQW
ncbi:unnamed protein product, partial [Meganyctiphanes norvegica]